MTFERNTRDLDLIWEETDKNSTLHEIGYQKAYRLWRWRRNSLRRRQKAQATASGTSATASKVADLKETLEDSAGDGEEIHMTWTQFGKKLTRIQLYMKLDIKRAYRPWRRRRNSLRRRQKAQATASGTLATTSGTLAMTSEVADLKEALEDSAGRRRRN
nr:hypothetical protein [Tanacetum cinerariifolium]